MQTSRQELREHVLALTHALGSDWRFSVLHSSDGNAVVRGDKMARGEVKRLVFKRFFLPANFATEYFIAHHLDHPLIVRSAKDVGNLPPLTLAMDYHPFGSLADVCAVLKRTMSRQEAWFVFEQTADAVNFLHSEGIVHGDLKSANILLDTEGRIKLIDFCTSVTNVGSDETFRYPYDAHVCKHMPPEARAKDLCDRKMDSFSLANLVSQISAASDISADPFNQDGHLCARLLHLLEVDFLLLLLDLLRADRRLRMSVAGLLRDTRFCQLHRSLSCSQRTATCRPHSDCIARNTFPGLAELQRCARNL